VGDLVFLHFAAGDDDVKLVDVAAENWRFRTQAWRERAVSKRILTLDKNGADNGANAPLSGTVFRRGQAKIAMDGGENARHGNRLQISVTGNPG
jgi:hypothetical protein